MAVDDLDMPSSSMPAEPAPSGAGSFFTRRIGALPVWGWAIAAVGGVVLGLVIVPRLMKPKGSATTGAVNSDFPLANVVPTPDPISQGAQGAKGDKGDKGDPGTSVTPPPPVTPPVTPPPVTVPAPKPAPAPAGQWVTVKPWHTGAAGEDSSLSLIAQRIYGNAAKWPTIYTANRDKISDPDKIYDGQKLWVPAL